MISYVTFGGSELQYFYFRVFYKDSTNPMHGILVRLPCFDFEEFQTEIDSLSMEPEVDKIIIDCVPEEDD